MVFALLLLLMSFPREGVPVEIHEGGICAGISWIAAADGESVSVDLGPDFRVYRFDGPGQQWWGAYSGNAAQVTRSEGKVLFTRDGVTVRSAIIDGNFRGYLATDREGWQNHFFGSVFSNTLSDNQFFERIDFSPSGQAKCKRNPSR